MSPLSRRDARADGPVNVADNWIEVTEHAYQRWSQRTPSDTKIGPRVAWFDAIELDVSDECNDDYRYHAETETILIVESNDLVTVYDARECRPALAAAVRRLRGDSA